MRSLQHVPHEAARADVPSAGHDHDVRTATRCHNHIVRLHPSGDLPPLPTLSGRYAIVLAALFALLCIYLLLLFFISRFVVFTHSSHLSPFYLRLSLIFSFAIVLM
jgi:hypothetical protein